MKNSVLEHIEKATLECDALDALLDAIEHNLLILEPYCGEALPTCGRALQLLYLAQEAVEKHTGTLSKAEEELNRD